MAKSQAVDKRKDGGASTIEVTATIYGPVYHEMQWSPVSVLPGILI